MKIVLLGIQGAGKSTQGNLLSKQLKVPYLSTGHIFREIAKERTNLGRHIKETIKEAKIDTARIGPVQRLLNNNLLIGTQGAAQYDEENNERTYLE
jgi:adenylate kinase